MIHIHGTPIGGKREEVARILRGRFALIPYGRTEDLPVAAEVCRGFVFDNGAFSAWRTGQPIEDWEPYFALVKAWQRHPRFMWAIVPDVIDGSEEQNDDLLHDWCHYFGSRRRGVPVWHLHESLDRLDRLCGVWETVALGSSGEYANPGTEKWWGRIAEAMHVVCDEEGRPCCRLHGLRMLDPAIFTRLPFASADSCNAAQNKTRPFGVYEPPTVVQKFEVIAARIESQQSADSWDVSQCKQTTFLDCFTEQGGPKAPTTS